MKYAVGAPDKSVVEIYDVTNEEEAVQAFAEQFPHLVDCRKWAIACYVDGVLRTQRVRSRRYVVSGQRWYKSLRGVSLLHAQMRADQWC